LRNKETKSLGKCADLKVEQDTFPRRAKWAVGLWQKPMLHISSRNNRCIRQKLSQILLASMHTQTHRCTRAHTRTLTLTHTHVHKHAQYMYTHIHPHIHTYTLTHTAHTHTHTRTHPPTNTNACTHAHTHSARRYSHLGSLYAHIFRGVYRALWVAVKLLVAAVRSSMCHVRTWLQ